MSAVIVPFRGPYCPPPPEASRLSFSEGRFHWQRWKVLKWGIGLCVVAWAAIFFIVWSVSVSVSALVDLAKRVIG